LIELYQRVGQLSLLTCVAVLLLSYAIYGIVLVSFPAKRQMLGKNLRALVAGALSP
jgi:hypothetical protein